MSAAGTGMRETVAPFDDAHLAALAQSADAGDAQSMFDLGVALYHGHGCPPDVPAALQWWRRGAEAGHVWCKLRLVDALCGGQGGRQGIAGQVASLCGSVAYNMDAGATGAEAGLAASSLPLAPVGCTRIDHEQRHVAELDAARHIADTPDAQLPRVFLKACKAGDANMVRALLAVTGDRAVDVHEDDEAAVRAACERGRVHVVRELLALTGDRQVNVHARNEAAFRGACFGGHLDVVRELLALAGDRTVNVHANCEEAFRSACGMGQMDVVRELLALTGERTVDVHACNEAAFRNACKYGHLDVVRELLGLAGDRAVNVHARGDGAFVWACEHGRLDVVRVLLGLTGDRLICPLSELPARGWRMLSGGLGDPHSPAVAAAWRAISSPGGMLRNAQAHGTTREAAGAGYRVYNWGRRGGTVLWRAVARRQP